MYIKKKFNTTEENNIKENFSTMHALRRIALPRRVLRKEDDAMEWTLALDQPTVTVFH